LVDAHCFGADRRSHLTDDDGTRSATANQAGRGERRCTKPEKFHAKLNSCRADKLRFNVAAAVGHLWYTEIPDAIGDAEFYSRSVSREGRQLRRPERGLSLSGANITMSYQADQLRCFTENQLSPSCWH
jgi:hypothetical protein